MGKNVHLANYTFCDLELTGQVSQIEVLLPDLLAGAHGSVTMALDFLPESYLAQWFKEQRGEDVTVWMLADVGALALTEAYRRLVEHLKLDAIIIVDGGVDSLMRGDEEGAGSLLEDTLSLIAVIYIGFVALVQADMKKLIAYSSISHMGFVTLGFFIFNPLGLEGALVQMISHGFVSAAMFLCVGVMYDRMHSRLIADYGGVVHRMPKFAGFFMLFAMANAGLPATSGFVGEFMVALGAIKYHFWIGFAAATTLVLGAAYTLWMYKRVIFGPVGNAHVAELTDINAREFLFLAALALCVLAMGVYPFPFTEVMHASVDNLLKHVAVSKL
jgi:hypothetical protein